MGNIYFAGDSTESMPGFIDSAVKSGVRTAMEIYLKNNVKSRRSEDDLIKVPLPPVDHKGFINPKFKPKMGKLNKDKDGRKQNIYK